MKKKQVLCLMASLSTGITALAACSTLFTSTKNNGQDHVISQEWQTNRNEYLDSSLFEGYDNLDVKTRTDKAVKVKVSQDFSLFLNGINDDDLDFEIKEDKRISVNYETNFDAVTKQFQFCVSSNNTDLNIGLDLINEKVTANATDKGVEFIVNGQKQIVDYKELKQFFQSEKFCGFWSWLKSLAEKVVEIVAPVVKKVIEVVQPVVETVVKTVVRVVFNPVSQIINLASSKANYQINSGLEMNLPVNVQDEDSDDDASLYGYITKQSDTKFDHWKLGYASSIRDAGCETIACYNVMKMFGHKNTFAQTIHDVERLGLLYGNGIAGGTLGVDPHYLHRYFINKGETNYRKYSDCGCKGWSSLNCKEAFEADFARKLASGKNFATIVTYFNSSDNEFLDNCFPYPNAIHTFVVLVKDREIYTFNASSKESSYEKHESLHAISKGFARFKCGYIFNNEIK